MNSRSSDRLFGEMLREEWRLHSHLFSGRRFSAFPLVVTLLVAGGIALLVATGTATETVVAGLHLLVFLFGLHTGSIGFIGRDALRNLLGDVTLLVFSARTLPLSRRRLLATFIVKDLAYYAVLFMAPIAVGSLPAIVWSMGVTSAWGLGATVGLLWVTLTGMFALGIATTIAGSGIAGRLGRAAVGGIVVGAVGAWWLGLPVVEATPYGVFEAPSLARVVASIGLIAVVSAVGALTFDVAQPRRSRTAAPTFHRWLARVGEPVATKTLLDVHRSSGGFAKVGFSAAILFLVTLALVDLAGQITGVPPSTGLAFGTVLGLTGFTTYNWLTQFDDIDAYLALPLGVEEVFAAKFRAFVLLGPLVGLAAYGLAIAVRGSPGPEALVGAVVLVGVACYTFGVTVYLTGLSPNEFLFDTVLFAVFGLAMVVALVPILVVAFAMAPLSAALVGLLGLVGVVLAGVGVGLYRLAGPRWTVRYRR